jgi:hypothetical protein
LGIGLTNPTRKVDIDGELRLRGGFYDSLNNVGAATSVLISTGTGTKWEAIATAALQGVQGAQGFQGVQGAQGRQGAQGAQGAQGFQGVQGAVGPQGLQGRQGAQGAVGPTGPQGVQGAVGPQGLQGRQGAQGAVGPQGLQGVQGATGPQGLQGVQGATGPQGLQGVQGAVGPQGLQGRQGAQGAVGPQGLQGIQGAVGPQGLQGRQGAQGAQGIQGAVGPQGLQGRQGAQGAQGVQGALGPTGPQGVQGAQGRQGAQGAQGVQGAIGPSTAINATAVTTNSTFYPVFVASAGSNQTPSVRTTATAFSFNPGTNILSTAGLRVLGEPKFDVMTSFNTSGAIEINRQDGVNRPFFIRTYNDGAASGNYMRFEVHNGTVGVANTVMSLLGSGDVGIGTINPQYKLHVVGSFGATTKSFIIDHPTKEGKKLQYGSLEGPELGVYVRGRTQSSIIELPDYWTGLVDETSITVNLTPIGASVTPRVKEVINNTVEVFSREDGELDYYFIVFAERKDVEKLVVEF